MSEEDWIEVADFVTFLILLVVLDWAQVLSFAQAVVVFFAYLLLSVPLAIVIGMTRKERCPTCGSRHWNIRIVSIRPGLKCKYCEAQIDEKFTYCPKCGRAQT